MPPIGPAMRDRSAEGIGVTEHEDHRKPDGTGSVAPRVVPGDPARLAKAVTSSLARIGL